MHQHDKTSRSFDQSAQNWDENQGRVNTANAVASAIKQSVRLNKSMTAVDYGCGTGLVTLQIVDQVKRIYAVDTSSGMLDIVSEKKKKYSINNIEPILIKNETDPLPTDSIDLFFSSMTFHHVPEYQMLLKNVFRALNPGGIVCIADLEKEGGDFHSDNTIVAHFGFDQKRLNNEMAQIGLKNITYQRIHSIKKETSEGEMKDFPVFLMTGIKEIR